ncbi:hypothetical protein D9M72_573600 [compost metagenome]
MRVAVSYGCQTPETGAPCQVSDTPTKRPSIRANATRVSDTREELAACVWLSRTGVRHLRRGRHAKCLTPLRNARQSEPTLHGCQTPGVSWPHACGCLVRVSDT